MTERPMFNPFKARSFGLIEKKDDGLFFSRFHCDKRVILMRHNASLTGIISSIRPFYRHSRAFGSSFQAIPYILYPVRNGIS